MARRDSSFASLTRCASPPLSVVALLADLDVAEADLLQHAHLVADAGDRLEQLGRFLDVHVEHVGDRVALELHLERLAVVAARRGRRRR